MNNFFFLYPPKEITSTGNFHYRIPKSDTGSDFREYMVHLVYSIADLYEMNKWDLLEILSQNLISIKRNLDAKQRAIDIQRKLLLHAS